MQLNIPFGLLTNILAHPDIDDYWAGDALLYFGKKAEALERFRKAIESCPREYRDQIARKLAELQAGALLAELNEAIEAAV